MEYHIPLMLRPGRFVMEAEPDGTELPEGFFSVRQTPCDFLEYTHPVYGGRPVRVYHVPENALLVAGYDADGELYQVSWVLNDEKQGLVYVAAPQFDAFISVTGRKMADRILQETGEISRLFLEHFYDGEAVDFAVKTASPADVENVRAQYGADADTDNSGNYPHERRLVCDSDTFRILLLCTAPEKRYPAYTETVKALGDSIIRQALPGLKLTPDFCIIDAEYD